MAVVFVLALPGVTRRMYAADEIEYYAFLRSAWFDRDLSFDNEYRHFADSGVIRDEGFRQTFLERTTATGLRLNFATVGCAILWSPFYAVADAGTRVARGFGASVEADGYSAPYISAVSIASAFYGLLALMLSWCAARRVLAIAVGEDAARDDASPTLAAWAVWIGTPLLFYMYVAPPMSHATSACTVAAFVLAWLIVRDRWSPGGMAVLGLLGALMAMVREQDAFFVAGPAIDFAWTFVTTRRLQMLVAALAGAATAVVAYLPQAAAYLIVNGRMGPSPLVSRKMTWTAPHGLQVLVSPEHGFLVWTPLAALALGGLVILLAGAPCLRRGARAERISDLRIVGLALTVMVALQVYVAGSVESWTVAGAFGQRRFVALTVVLVIGLALVMARMRRGPGRLALGAAVALAAWWNIGLIVQFGTGLMDRQRLEPRRNAYNTFVTVPRQLPAIAYRYLVERERFYRPAPAADHRP